MTLSLLGVTEAQHLNSTNNKDIQKQRAEYSVKSAAEVHTADASLDFWENSQIMNEVQVILNKAERNKTITSKQHLLVIAYLAASITFRNGQWSDVVQNMMVKEFLKEMR